MDIKTDNIANLLKEQIAKFDLSVDVSEVGEVIEVGDGVARVSGLENVMSSELVELPNGVFGMALNLEDDNVGLVLFGETSLVKEGDLAKRTGRVVEVPVGEAMLGHSRSGVEGIYDLAEYLPQIREWLQVWNDHLDTLRPKANHLQVVAS